MELDWLYFDSHLRPMRTRAVASRLTGQILNAQTCNISIIWFAAVDVQALLPTFCLKWLRLNQACGNSSCSSMQATSDTDDGEIAVCRHLLMCTSNGCDH